MQLGYDANGRRSSLTLPNGVVANYTYDAASQLTAIAYSHGGSVLGDLAYTYDGGGRRASVSGSLAHTALPQPLGNAIYNPENQLIQFGTSVLSYDADGNLTSDGSHTYTWDARNHLVAIDGGSTASFTYDPFGRRISKTIYGITTGYLYSGASVVQELSGASPSANLLTGGADEIFTRTDSSGPDSFLRDGQGSTTALTDSSGSILEQYTYGSYGNTSTSGSPSTNSYQYIGREADATGLYYFRSRYYSPITQTFISEDPADCTCRGDRHRCRPCIVAAIPGFIVSHPSAMGLRKDGAPRFEAGPLASRDLFLWAGGGVIYADGQDFVGVDGGFDHVAGYG